MHRFAKFSTNYREFAFDLNQFNNENEWWYSYCSGCALVWCDSVRYQEGGRNVNQHTENDQRKVIFIELSNLFSERIALSIFYYLISSSHTHTHSHKYLYICICIHIFIYVLWFSAIQSNSHFWICKLSISFLMNFFLYNNNNLMSLAVFLNFLFYFTLISLIDSLQINKFVN